MAGLVAIDTGKVDPLLPANQVPRKKWRNLALARKEYCRKKFRDDCRDLVFFVEDARANQFLGYKDERSYLEKGLYVEHETVDAVISYLKRHEPGAISYAKAKTLAAQAKAKPLITHAEAGAKGGRGKKASDDGTSFTRGSNSAAYLLARLARDHHDVLDAYERGEYPSARSAAIAAGIIKPPMPYQVLCRVWKKASVDERQRFKLWIGG